MPHLHSSVIRISLFISGYYTVLYQWDVNRSCLAAVSIQWLDVLYSHVLSSWAMSCKHLSWVFAIIDCALPWLDLSFISCSPLHNFVFCFVLVVFKIRLLPSRYILPWTSFIYSFLFSSKALMRSNKWMIEEINMSQFLCKFDACSVSLYSWLFVRSIKSSFLFYWNQGWKSVEFSSELTSQLSAWSSRNCVNSSFLKFLKWRWELINHDGQVMLSSV